MDNESTLTSWADNSWPDYAPDQILPGLFQGGTEDDEVLGYPAPAHHYARLGHRGGTAYSSYPGEFAYPFDLVVTLYADAQPAPWGVREYRFGFPDGPISNDDAQEAIELARLAHRAWSSGRSVLIRCQAGVNRSGLVSALVLMLEGYQPAEAIELLRQRRSRVVLSNGHFENWLLTEAADHLHPSTSPSTNAA